MDILSTLSAARLLPVVVLDDASAADALAGALVEGGLPVAEVTFRTAAARDSIRAMADRGDVLVGAGTVGTVAQVDQAVAAGARFVVSPGLSRAVVERCQELGVLVVPGVVTATEIQAALELGLTTVKFLTGSRPATSPESPSSRPRRSHSLPCPSPRSPEPKESDDGCTHCSTRRGVPVRRRVPR